VGGVPEGWRHARLIPTLGVRSQLEQEKRATSCLLAVMHGVPEFGHSLLRELGAPKSPVIETFAEVRFKDASGKTVIPDGAIVCRRAGKSWTCLVEVKTGAVRLRDDQVTSYLDIARTHGFDGVLTISTLRGGDPPVRDVAERWDQFTNYLSLSLSQELGAHVTVYRPRSQTTPARLDELVKSLDDSGELFSTLRIPDAIGDLEIRTNLKSRQTQTSVSIDAPREGRAKSRLNWLLRQLRDAPDALRIEAAFPNTRSTTVAKLGDVRDDPAALYHPADSRREPRAFVVTQIKPMGQKRGRVEGSFVRETASQAVEFYRDIVQNLKAWQAPAPRIRSDPEPPEPDAPDGPVVPAWTTEDTGDSSPSGA
jgi:hypothetical protein